MRLIVDKGRWPTAFGGFIPRCIFGHRLCDPDRWIASIGNVGPPLPVLRWKQRFRLALQPLPIFWRSDHHHLLSSITVRRRVGYRPKWWGCGWRFRVPDGLY